MAGEGREPGLRRRGRVWWVDASHNGTRVRKSLHTTDYRTAVGRARRIRRAIVPVAYDGDPVAVDWLRTVAGIPDSGANWLGRLLRQSVKNARAKGLPHELSFADVKVLAMRCGGRCEVTRVALRPDSGAREPWIPSLDRVDATLGYSFENCRIVCFAANMAMRQWGEGALLRMLQSYLLHGAGENVGPDSVTVGGSNGRREGGAND